ncbi:leucyl/phenylalanyl-tRNA--protein transferase [Deinococcus maricopensis]|uniref:Leucyl/phenylalanyl-tRNA--protein transferase n=1 Tax=Deinococcus maricopensis (strain DSM 21211 / LMG 22137 / NRRL B-23946 / LB-34) TaxID=709986 RepID=E8U9Y1_DEIML|nr:leucyl/phenylalanyl-tRNA--protein transferase [Deinococcus maricopensis]ADV67870.1 leucyl/phenylalanyl-tRNA/protein transferase [Deinococcus maricopensis DSM 21211]
MPTAHPFLHHPDPLTREIARGYATGAFLMDNGDGLQWYTTPERALVPLGDALHVPRSLRRHLTRFDVHVDRDFDGVLDGCRAREETWISDELADIYRHLHGTGLARSFETWQDGRLAGGVLGLALGGAFIGETMFHAVTHASKVALVHLARALHGGGFTLLDAQIQNPHLARFGTTEISSDTYQQTLQDALTRDATLRAPEPPQSWPFAPHTPPA